MTLRYIDDFSIDDAAEALRRISITPKARQLITALATAPDRAMSRYELALAIGGTSPQACNTTYGSFVKKLAHAIDPTLGEEWKPASGVRGDWVMFASYGPARWTAALPDEEDTWVFVMRETLARALDRVGIAPYTPLSDAALDAVRAAEDDEGGLDDSADEYDPLELDDPLLEIEEAAEELEGLSETEREAVVRARVGQGVFRDRVMELWGGQCAVTGADFAPALVASHIVPWSDCDNDARLDPGNGLLLVGTLDRLFDARFISFDDDGAILISPFVPESSYATLGLRLDLKLRGVPDCCRPYLAVHRESYLQGGVVG